RIAQCSMLNEWISSVCGLAWLCRAVFICGFSGLFGFNCSTERNDMKPTTRTMIVSCVLMLLLSVSAAHAASETVYPNPVTPGGRFNDAPNWELGTIFRATVPGKITHARVFSLSNESGDHQVRIWRNADNTVIAGPITWNYGGDDAWITLDIPDV